MNKRGCLSNRTDEKSSLKNGEVSIDRVRPKEFRWRKSRRRNFALDRIGKEGALGS
jgi:hypothetical protein